MKIFLIVSIVVPILLGVWLKHQFGGGKVFISEYTPSQEGIVDLSSVEKIPLEAPPGCVTISPVNGRIFFDIHPMSMKAGTSREKPVVYELLADGSITPWPSPKLQAQLLVAPFGIHADPQGRIWFVEPSALDRAFTRVLALDVETSAVVFDQQLKFHQGRVAQDIRVSPDGKYLILADTGMLGLTSGNLLVLDIAQRKIVRTVWHADSLNPQDFYIRQPQTGQPTRVFGGLLTFRPGIDGLAFSPDGQWLYLGTMIHNTLYRISTSKLLDLNLTNEQVTNSIEAVAAKPINDGIAFTPKGSLILTDIENNGLAVLESTILGVADGTVRKRKMKTLLRDEAVIWADSVEAVGDIVVFADSAIFQYIQQDLQPPSPDFIQSLAPFHLYRFHIPSGM